MMKVKELWSKVSQWLPKQKDYEFVDYRVSVDDNGLISQDQQPAGPADEQQAVESKEVVVKTVSSAEKNQPLERLREGFDQLITQLQNINQHLDHQITQHEDLVNRIDRLPKLLESFPAVVENQKQVIDKLFEELKAMAFKDQQFVEAVEKIPQETVKQTDALVDITHQLSAAAETDVQLAEGFNKFNNTLDRLNRSTASQTDSIMQMSKTFAASDRYLKYLVSKHNRRFTWVFVTAVSVCILAILALVVAIAVVIK